MKKCVFINPYFGKLPSSFPVFLKTCEKNTDFQWIFFTDDETDYEFPQNVIRIQMSFDDMKNLAQSKFDFPIVLDKPYKLCDYKPAYGYLFEEYISGYDFWGHCDIDTIMGDLDSFLTDELLRSYDKIFCLGHMILYKNTYENNRSFMLPVEGHQIYKESFSTSKITKFDETYGGVDNVNTIFEKNNKRVFTEDWSENFCMLPTRFTKVRFDARTYSYHVEPYKDVLYLWNNGHILKYYMSGSDMAFEEVLYMHFQERKMKYDKNILNSDRFLIVPNKYKSIKYESITEEIFRKTQKNPISFHFFEFYFNRLKKKMKRDFR
jgi:hypothetical protein